MHIVVLFAPTLEAAKTLTLDLIEERSEGPSLERLRRRQSGDGWRSTDLIYNSTVFSFYVDISIGDNSKSVKLAVVQNPFTWVARKWNRTRDCSPGPLMDATACGQGQYSGLFNLYPPDSTSYRNLTSDFDIEYTDDRFATGIWGRDDFRLGQLTIPNVNFGVSSYYNATPQVGLSKSDSTTQYPTFLEVMQTENIINTVTYGIYLGDIRGRSDSGKSITFGGIDAAKFQRPLRTFSSRVGYTLELFKITILSRGNTVLTPLDQPKSRPESVNLNFGTASIHVPTDIFEAIMADLGASPADDYYLKTLPPDDSGIEFVFGGNLTIFVPYSQMITPSSVYDGWYLVLLYPNDDRWVFGTPFFRSAYVFYDFQNEELSLAPALYNTSASNVTEIGINNASVTTVEWLLQDPNAIIDPVPDPIPDPTPEPPPDPSPKPPTPSGGGTNVGAIAGGAVGGVAALAIIVIAVWYFFFRNKDTAPPPMAPDTVPPTPMVENKGNGGGFPGGGYTNDQFSPIKPNFTTPVMPPVQHAHVAELSPVSYAGGQTSPTRFENVAGTQRVHELA